MLQFKTIQTEEQAAEILAQIITEKLTEKKKVLWLVPGGSNISIAVKAMDLLLEKNEDKSLEQLYITLTDERYGNVGHVDSNWQQLSDKGFAFPEHSRPVLVGLSREETIEHYNRMVTELFDVADYVIGQFGIGGDGHIAGVLPHTPGVESVTTTVGYDSPPYARLSLTLSTLKKLDAAYAFVFGSSKKEALILLKKDGQLTDIPSRVLRLLSEATVFTDQSIYIK